MSLNVDDNPSGTASVFLGLGGNVGDVLANMAAALQRLDQHSAIQVKKVSDVYKTPPWGITDQDWFLNCCAEISTVTAPMEVLAICLEIEAEMKRKRTLRWGPRTVDIDILLFDDHQIQSETLTVPHPRMHERAFVMQPLADIAPKKIVEGKSVQLWADQLLDEQIVKLEVAPNWWRETSA